MIMINIYRALNNNRTVKALTGLNKKEFQKLAVAFTRAYDEYMREKYYRKEHQRGYGGGSKPVLKTGEEKLFFVLTYYKTYPTYDLQSVIFDLDRGHCCRWVQRLTIVLERVLKEKMVLPARKISSMKQFLELIPDARIIFIDGTERPRRRPKDSQKQKEYYSGKKKKHTIKNLVATDKGNKICVLSPTHEGKKHDFAICKKEDLPKNIPRWVETYVDTGFEGIGKKYPHLKLMKPFKKPPKKELPRYKKRRNTAIAKIRIQVEHAIGGVKRFRILSDTYRNIKKGFDDTAMLISCGLWNYHLQEMKR